ncbi:immunoglobulin domain-containing protein oig-4-like [Epargyreus clarus]|uniref:immunoglobulin domain-containing protein oig-4-like n=1 Tax=Epargyreus clarus TaxID=520877 RepID=UPI003C2EDD5B
MYWLCRRKQSEGTQGPRAIIQLIWSRLCAAFATGAHSHADCTEPVQMLLKNAFLTALLLLLVLEGDARRGRTRSRTKSKVQIGLPITGKYRDPESDQYYNNNDGAKILLASHFDLEYVLGHKIAFLCIAKGSPRPHITWFKDGVEIFAHHYLHIHEWPIGEDRVKSKIEIDPATQMDAGVYECTADNMYSIDRRSFKTDFSIAFD